MYPLIAYTQTAISLLVALVYYASAPEPTTSLTTTLPENSAMRYYEPKAAVLEHLPHIHDVREEMGISEERYSDALLLAIIHRETGGTGDVHAHRKGSKFWTHFQFSDAYLADAKRFDPDIPVDSAKEAHGMPDVPVRVFLAHMEQYAHVHLYQPSWVATIHKCGISSALKIRGWMRSGQVNTLDEGLEVLDISNDSEYVGSWSKLLTTYSLWIAGENGALGYGTKSKKYEGAFDGWRGDEEEE